MITFLFLGVFASLFSSISKVVLGNVGALSLGAVIFINSEYLIHFS
jgi:hypothetical protein